MYDNISLVQEEVARQLELWGVDFDDKNTANDWVAYICRYVSKAGVNDTPEQFKTNLIKAAALCVSAMNAIDRNGDCAPGHWMDGGS